MEPSAFATLSVAFASTSYFCSTISSNGSMANAVGEKSSGTEAASANAKRACRLFIPQRYHGINFHGAAGRKVAGEGGGDGKQADHTDISHNIGRAHSVE